MAGRDQTPPTATSMVGHGTRRGGLTDLPSAPSFTGCRISQNLRRQAARLPLPAHIISRPRLRALSQQASHPTLDDSGPSRLSPTQVLEATYPSIQVSTFPDNDAVPVSPTLRQANFGPTLTDAGRELFPSTGLQESSENFRSQAIPTVEPGHAALVISNTDALSPNGSLHHGEAASERRFVGYGEVDPEKHPKRRDRTEDKHRKQDMGRWHGACFACRKAKRQCKGEEVCNRCRKSGLACVRTCDSCWATKKPCDEKAPCKNCQRLGIDCHRPSVPTITFGDSRADDLPPLPTSPQLAHTKSTASVNNHTMWETGSTIDAPLSWHMGFGVETGLQRSGKRRRSRSLEQALQDRPREGYAVPADLRSEESPMVGNSDVALAGSQPYSQQITDVDLHQTLTQDSTIVAASEDALNVPNKGWNDWESCSGCTEHSHFDDATYYTSEISSHLGVGSLSLEGLMQEDEG